jgi:hypothetical protein
MIFIRRFPDLKLLCVYESFSFILRGHEFDNERILSSKVSYYAGMISFSLNDLYILHGYAQMFIILKTCYAGM